MSQDFYYLISIPRKGLNYPDLKRAVREPALEHQRDVVLIEDKASGTQLIQDQILTSTDSTGLNGAIPRPATTSLYGYTPRRRNSGIRARLRDSNTWNVFS